MQSQLRATYAQSHVAKRIITQKMNNCNRFLAKIAAFSNFCAFCGRSSAKSVPIRIKAKR